MGPFQPILSCKVQKFKNKERKPASLKNEEENYLDNFHQLVPGNAEVFGHDIVDILQRLQLGLNALPPLVQFKLFGNQIVKTGGIPITDEFNVAVQGFKVSNGLAARSDYFAKCLSQLFAHYHAGIGGVGKFQDFAHTVVQF